MTQLQGQEITFKQKFYNKYVVLRHDFHFELDISPQDLLANLDQQIDSQELVNRYVRYEVTQTAKGWDVEFNMIQLRQSQKNSTPTANGVTQIFRDATGKTIFEGSITLMGLQFWVGIIFLIVISPLIALFVVPQSPFGFILIWPFIAFGAGAWWHQLYRGRNQLIQFIERATHASPTS